ncbi:MAG: alpha/beta hydrolase [Deltaproteobacteria bacterium]|nr:alpha/beta hydrolase [Deltaproteobacteria bacterium]MBW2181731.1 alpha/beta hydrolase [Deltaproteobacteria bacterium]
MAYINSNNINMFYDKSGQGKTIVFLHGYTGSGKDWTRQISTLSGRHTTIAVDHRGHGRSEAPSLESDYSIDISANDIYNILNILEISKCCLVGHSMGGFMSLQFALEHPERVSALILVDTSSGNWDVPPGYDTIRGKLDELARNESLEAAFEYDVENNPVKKDKFRKHPELREIARQKVKNTSVDGYIYFSRAFKKWTPVTERLNEINVPTLIILGEEDIGFVNASQILKNSIKNAELKIIPNAGHNPHEESPEIFNKHMLDFLKTNL